MSAIAPHIIIVGNPIDGFKVYGPFESGDEAINWASHTVDDEHWSLAWLWSPM